MEIKGSHRTLWEGGGNRTPELDKDEKQSGQEQPHTQEDLSPGLCSVGREVFPTIF